MRVLAIAIALVLPSSAFAEKDETSVGLEGVLVLPGFSSEDPTAFALATWGVGAVFQYGLIDDLYLSGRFAFMTFRGQSVQTRDVFGGALSGTLRFETFQYQAEVGARYKVYAGHDLSPYVEGHVGFLWSGYRDQQFVTPDGRDYGLDLPNAGEGAFTLSTGVALDYRLFNLVFIGAAVRFVLAIGDQLHRYYLSIPVQLSVFW